MTHEQWIEGTKPKVAGTMNLGSLFEAPLDFFISLSSVGGIVGTYGAGNYCAGNTFQDAFARHNASLGLPVWAIDLGMITTEGVVADRDDQVAKLISKQGVCTNTIQEVLALVNYAIQNPPGESPTKSQILCGVTRFSPESNNDDAARQRLDARFSHIWINTAQERSKSTGTVHLSVQPTLRAASDPRTAIEAALGALKTKISQLLSIPESELQTDRSVPSYGVDSLISVELRNWIISQVGAHIQMLELMSSLPMVKLAEMVARRSRFVRAGLFEDGANGVAN